ncbi:MAG: hypothetical protein M3Q91_13840, partial [Acidobacteriota bacterium]|nr:hypothetical protein [Acidobacteriota bacterium]
ALLCSETSLKYQKAIKHPASPAAHSTPLEPSLADEGRAIRGRVHAVVRRGVPITAASATYSLR